MEDKKKSFIKGLFLGIGCTLVTALLGITIYGCASVNAKGTKAFGDSEINVLYDNNWADVSTSSTTFTGRRDTIYARNAPSLEILDVHGVIGRYEDGDYYKVLNLTDVGESDDDSNSFLKFQVTSNGANSRWYLNITANDLSGVGYTSAEGGGSVVTYMYFYDGTNWSTDTDTMTFSALANGGTLTSNVGLNSAGYLFMHVVLLDMECPIATNYVYNQPIYDHSVSSSTSEASWVTYSFAKGIYPANLGTEVNYGNVATINDHNGETDFWVYIPVSTEVNGLWYDRIGIHYGSLRKWLPYNGHSGNSLWFTEFLFLDGSTRQVSLDFSDIPYNWFFSFEVTLERYVSSGSSAVEWEGLTLAKTPELVWENTKGYQDTRLQWVYYINSFTFAPYSLDDLVTDITWYQTTSSQVLQLIGGLPAGYNPANPDLMDAFGLIGKAFEGFQVVFNMQLFPFATLGAFLCVPLVVAVILFVVRLFKR